MLIPKWYYSIS